MNLKGFMISSRVSWALFFDVPIFVFAGIKSVNWFFLIGFVFLVLPALSSTNTGRKGYAFFLGGKRVTPEFLGLRGSPKRKQKGDLALFHGFVFPLGIPGKYDFSLEPLPIGRLWLEKGPGITKKTLLAIKLGLFQRGRFSIYAKGGKGLKPREIQGLQGVTLGVRPKIFKVFIGIGKVLDQVDPRKCFVLLDMGSKADSNAGEKKLDPISLLPRGIRHLAIISKGQDPPRGLNALHALEFFSFRAFPDRVSFDFSLLRNSACLGFLEIQGFFVRVSNVSILSDMETLEVLRLRGCHGDGLGPRFPGSFKRLKVLALRECSVKDLGSLKKVRTLEKLDVVGCPVSKIPIVKMPRMKRFCIVGCRVPPIFLARFKVRNPSCKTVFSFKDALLERVAYADRLELVAPAGKVLRAFSGKDQVCKLLSLLDIQEKNSEGRYGCAPELKIFFLHGEEFLVRLSIVNAFSNRNLFEGKVLCRSDSIWPNEVYLSRKSSMKFYEWLDKVLPCK